MKRNFYKHIVLFISAIAVFGMFVSCKPDVPGSGDLTDSILYQGVEEIDLSNYSTDGENTSRPKTEDAINEIVQNISSPVEVAALVKSLNVPFSTKYLASTDYLDSYNSSYKKAISLGIFGADLGYLNMYKKTGSAVEYLTAIKTMAEGIKVGQFFDFALLKRLATNNENLDSLMYISVSSFNKMDKYLLETNRSELSKLIVAGVWIEGLYLATQVAKDNPHDDLVQAVGEQKMILDLLIGVLESHEDDPYFKHLLSEYLIIKEEFDKIEITVEYGEPEEIEIDGMLMIIQNEKSFVHISRQQLDNIIKKTEGVRNRIIES